MDTVAFVNSILLDAIKKGASDIHFEIYDSLYRIRYRQDGILHQVASPSFSYSARITARIKVMANLDISEKRIPQDGGFTMEIDNSRFMDFRVSTCPISSGGEKVVVRLLDSSNTQLGIEALGFSTYQKELFLKAINQPQGMVLVTGPTGSGKTVTLYTALHLLNTTEVNISTVEDPVEIKLSGINQVNINNKAGLTFPQILRAFLRQDPDIIMVGEIRDCETAEIATKAAQTGHLVLSTLHTNSAAESLDRLLQMGIPAFTIASSIRLIIAQRLVRKLCDLCKTKTINPIIDNAIAIYKAVGCSECIAGYKGRVGVFEVMAITKTMMHLILSGANVQAILDLAKYEGMLTLFESGIDKVKLGITSMEEINRVTSD